MDTAVEEWADKSVEAWQAKLARSKAILKGRTGGEQLVNSVLTGTIAAAADDLSEFLES
jgi:hypothetical protein